MSLWEYAALTEDQQALVDELLAARDKEFGSGDGGLLSSASTAPSSSSTAGSSDGTTTTAGGDDGGLHNSLNAAELSCSTFIAELDSLLKTLQEVGSAYEDVTGRTNSLMVNCESLLEQQRTLEATAEVLRKTLQPFAEIETVAALLGIPFDARGLPAGNDLPLSSVVPTTGLIIDPRSPEFQDILTRLTKAMTFLDEHRELYDSSRYYRWLEQLFNRATSLVAKAMRELLESAAKLCQEADRRNKATQRAANSHLSKADRAQAAADDTPIESHPLYQRFRGLGFRMQELGQLLKGKKGESSGSDGGSPDKSRGTASKVRGYEGMYAEVKQSYAILRTQLLIPFIKDFSLNTTTDTGSGGSKVALSPGIRHAYSTLLRITQLEQQLFDTLFGENEAASSTSKGGTAAADDGEILRVVEAICNVVGDFLRPLIIKESSVDELCRVITTLSEDIRSQIIAMNVPRPLLIKLLAGLDRTVNDAQERLSYCAEIRLRSDVVLFEPSMANLNYPEILSTSGSTITAPAAVAAANAADAAGVQDGTEAAPLAVIEDEPKAEESSESASDDMSRTWYPPLRDTLALLSKLYGVVDMSVFEDFARRSVTACVAALKAASEGVKKRADGTNSQLNGDLFLVRHLLVLREQLLPFEIRMQGTEKRLDFRPTGAALSHLVTNARSVLRMDVSNGLLQLAREGLPALQENQRDAKRDLDAMLKAACHDLKLSSLKVLVAPLSVFLAKVEAFVGVVPSESSGNIASTLMVSEDNSVLLPQESATMLKVQAFVRAERIKEVLEQTSREAAEQGPLLQNTLRLYIDNAIARTILMKPVQLEVDLIRRKVQCIVASCIDAGTARREIEALLRDSYSAVLNQLST